MMVDDAAGIKRLLTTSRTIAVVGLSAKPGRPSFDVARYMRAHGYRIVPVNPAYAEVLGEKCYASLTDIPFKVDMVNCFRKSEDIPPIAEEAILIGAPCLWLQQGIINVSAQERATAAGLSVVVDRCLKIEHRQLLGGPAAVT